MKLEKHRIYELGDNKVRSDDPDYYNSLIGIQPLIFRSIEVYHDNSDEAEQ